MFSKKQALYLLGDLIAITVALLGSFQIRFPGNPEVAGGLIAILENWTGASLLFIGVYLTSLYVFNNYDDRRPWVSWPSYWTVLAGTAAAFLALSAAFYLTLVWRFGRGLLGLQLAFAGAGVCVVRLVLELLFTHRLRRRRVLVVGCGEAARSVRRDLIEHPDFEPIGFLNPESGTPATIDRLPVHPRALSMAAFAREHDVDLLILAPDNGTPFDDALIRDLMVAKMDGVEVLDFRTFIKDTTGRIPIRHVDRHYFLVGGGFDIPSRPFLRNAMRLADVVVAAVGLLVSLPLWLMILLAIKIDSRGPAFFSQVRVGLGKKPFRILKFRTMVAEAEADGPAWADVGRDVRVTRFGRLLRRTRLDELPQFINILTGDMSFIGPRPERPEFVEELEKQIPFYDLRFAVRPGLTGWAQVNYRYAASADETAVKLEYDLYFIQHNSLLLSLRILLKTLQTIVMRPGS